MKMATRCRSWTSTWTRARWCPGCLRTELLRAMARAHPRVNANARTGWRWRISNPSATASRGSSTAVLESSEGLGARRRVKATSRRFPAAVSDGHQPEAIADAVGDFFTLLQDWKPRSNCRRKFFCSRSAWDPACGAAFGWTGFARSIGSRGTGFYPKLRMLLGDYSPATLDKSKTGRQGTCRSVQLRGAGRA